MSDLESRSILDDVARHFSAKFDEFGATPRGVDWNSTESQEIRFAQLLRVCTGKGPFRIIDYGCGYGALAGYMRANGYEFDYVGFELSRSMREYAQKAHGSDQRMRFLGPDDELPAADYVVASGIFNSTLGVAQDRWHAYVLETIDRMSALSTAGFAFNALTKYSDADRMRSDLYYADPGELFDHCMRRHSRKVALLHDYQLYDFTVIVRKNV